jgi:hypothetical protein
MLYIDWFKTNFENFAKEKEKFVPAFGISYRISDPQKNPEEDLSITCDLTNKKEGLFDLNITDIDSDVFFIKEFNRKLKQISGEDNSQYEFRLELATIPLGESNNFWNFLYAHLRMTEDFYNKNRNISKSGSHINKIIYNITEWGLREHKRPTELGFNYNKSGLVEADARILRGHALEEFIKHNKLKGL